MWCIYFTSGNVAWAALSTSVISDSVERLFQLLVCCQLFLLTAVCVVECMFTVSIGGWVHTGAGIWRHQLSGPAAETATTTRVSSTAWHHIRRTAICRTWSVLWSFSQHTLWHSVYIVSEEGYFILAYIYVELCFICCNYLHFHNWFLIFDLIGWNTCIIITCHQPQPC